MKSLGEHALAMGAVWPPSIGMWLSHEPSGPLSVLAWHHVTGILGILAEVHPQNCCPSLTRLGQSSHSLQGPRPAGTPPHCLLLSPEVPTWKWGELGPFSPLGPFPPETLPFLLTGSRPDGKGRSGLSGVPFVVGKLLLSMGECIQAGGSPACMRFHHHN